ncbi:MAG: DUF3078 domain-containing protein [Bacteroidales bacterium]|nr:DUF3078 domain-containing protein [Bacteroidales bacterium]
MKIYIKFFLFVLLIPHAYCQITEKEKELRKLSIDTTLLGWKSGGILNFTLSQVSLVNWAAGGNNSYAGSVLFNAFIKYNSTRFSMENVFDFGLGMQKQASLKYRKTDDKIDFSSKYGYLLKNKIYVAVLVNFKTQSMPGYNYPNDSVMISDFMSPAYLLFASGIDWKPKEYLSVFLAPLTGKTTFVNNQNLANAGAFGVEPAVYEQGVLVKKGKTFRAEFGGYLKTSIQRKFKETYTLHSKLELFSNYFKNPQNIDVYWELLLGIKLSKYLAFSVNTILIYDDDVKVEIKDKQGNITGKGPRMQFKEIIGIGFSYKF